MRIISQQSGKVRALKVVQSSRAARVGDYAGHGFLLSPPAKRTDHLLSTPLVERMCHRPRPLRVGNPRLFLRLPLLRSSSHRHARSLRTSALDYARNFTSESRLSPRTARAQPSNPLSSDELGAEGLQLPRSDARFRIIVDSHC